MKTVKFEIKIRALATELFKETPGVAVVEWPICGWTEGFRAIVVDVTDAEKQSVVAIECGGGLSVGSFEKLANSISAQIQSHFTRTHLGSIVSEVNNDESLLMRKQRANQNWLNENLGVM